MNVDLKLDWASHKAAKYACEHWHYSKCMPVGKTVKIGAWEDSKFIGVIIFSRGANKNMLKPYGLEQDQGCELTRVALNKHQSNVSRILKIAFSMLKKLNNKLNLIVSYADTGENHHGGIYQAGNWIYDHFSKGDQMLVNGKKIHRKTLYSKYGHSSKEKLVNAGFNVVVPTGNGKHRYLMPLNKKMRDKIQHLTKPYPKRIPVEEQQTPSVEGSATLTDTLQTREVANG